MYCEGTADILDVHGCRVDTHVFIYTHTPSAADSLQPRDGTQCVKRLRIDWDINEKHSADVVTTLAQCFALITFEVLNQTPPNLLGSCRSSSRWCLQNYIKNGWELTSESTSKWIYILKYSNKFHTNLINNCWSTRSNFTEFTGQWA